MLESLIFANKYNSVIPCRGQGRYIRVERASGVRTERKTPPSPMKLAVVPIKLYFKPDNINSFSNDNKLNK